MIIIDNSEHARNGDYTPTRFEAQSDAVSLIFSAKTQANAESSVGLMTMGGKGPEVLVTLTTDTDFGKILSGLHNTKIKGELHLTTGIQVAGLALKHRQNKTQKQRIICFVGSPILEDEKTLVKLAKKMKKNNIAVDFVNFGEIESDNTSKLQAFVEAINASDNSHLATIPPGPHLLSDLLVSTPILNGDGVPGGGASSGGDTGGDLNGFEFGVDPSLDPELALALRLSMQEEKARVEKEQKAKEEREAKERAEGSSTLGTVKEDDETTSLLKEGEGDSSKKDDDKMDTN